MISIKRVLAGCTSFGLMIALLYCITVQPAQGKKEVKAYYASKTSKELVTEPVAWFVKAVYSKNPLSRLLLPVSGLVGKYATKYAEKAAHSTNPAKVKANIDRFQALYKNMLNMHEYTVPPEGFKTFNDWFIRTFKDLEKNRPMDGDALSVVSPADSKLLIIPDLSQNAQMIIKEQRFNVAKFLDNAPLAQQFFGGVMMIFRLAPYDYHRYHYPFDCTVSTEHYIKGKYHSVNPRAFVAGVKPLTENKRSYELLTPVNTACPSCTVAMVQVGATAVASIVNGFMDYAHNTCKEPSTTVYKKGQEMGYFQFGGSTLVLLFPKGSIVPDAQIVENSQHGYETAVKVRETIATWKVRL